MINSEVLSLWYEALYEEDCDQVMKLLAEHPSLLKEGWQKSSRKVEGSRLNYWMPRTKSNWFGRTALHVGARRGCTKLLEQIIGLCFVSKPNYKIDSDEETASSSGGDQEVTAGSPEEVDTLSSRKVDQEVIGSFSERADGTSSSSSEDEEVSGDSLEKADPVESARRQRKDKNTPNAGSCVAEEDILVAERPSQAFEVPVPPKPANRNLEVALSGARSKREVEDRKLGRARTVGNSNLKYETGEKIALMRVRSMARLAERSDRVSLEDLLPAKDGQYKLDAFAMAVLNGNKDILKIILHASLHCEAFARRYKIYDRSHGDESSSVVEKRRNEETARSEKETKLRNQLREITQKCIAGFSGDRWFSTCLEWYDKHRDFNFLPVEEYLFHFLFVDFEKISDKIGLLYTLKARIDREAILERAARDMMVRVSQVASGSLDLWFFLWELQDGQGRPPLHVAVDEGTVARCWGPVYSFFHGEDSEFKNPTETRNDMIMRMINACDGRERTALHRIIALGKVELFHEYIEAWKVIALESLTKDYRKKKNMACKLLGKVPPSMLDASVSLSFLDFSWGAVSTAHGFKGFQSRDEKGDYDSHPDNSSVEDGGIYQWSSRRAAPIHSAIIHKRSEMLRAIITRGDLFDELGSETLNCHTDSLLRTPLECRVYSPGSPKELIFEVDCLELAALVGDGTIVGILLAAFQQKKSKSHWEIMTWRKRISHELVNLWKVLLGTIRDDSIWKNLWLTFWLCFQRKKSTSHSDPKKVGDDILKNPWPALHLAAGEGRYEILKALVDHDYCDPFMEDRFGNTPLHHATKGAPVEFGTHLLDYVNCQQIFQSQKNRDRDIRERYSRRILNVNYDRSRHSHEDKSFQRDDFIVEREGCINLLVQKGCDVFKTNRDKEAPDPGSGMDGKFLSWWYEKQAREFGSLQNTFAVAANAISVTAALVATASYVGPLQPPLGYGTDSNNIEIGLQLNHGSVKVFTICDTMSFYLAIAAIIFSFIPSLPMPQQSMLDELRRTRVMLTLAVTVLLPSIIFVLVAFASSSIAVIRANTGTWNHGGLAITLVTACLGGSVCVVAILLFCIRLIGFIFYKRKWIRKAYNFTSF